MLIKNLDRHELWIVLPVRVILDIIASLKFLIFDSPQDAWAVLKGAIYSSIRFQSIRGKRPKYEESYLNKKLAGIYRKSIVCAYYIRKKRKFPQLGIQ